MNFNGSLDMFSEASGVRDKCHCGLPASLSQVLGDNAVQPEELRASERR